MDKALFLLPLPETASNMQIKCRPLERQNILVCPLLQHTIIFTCAPYSLLSAIGNKRSVLHLESRLCRVWGLTGARNMSPDNFLTGGKNTACLGKISLYFRCLSIAKPEFPGYKQVEPLVELIQNWALAHWWGWTGQCTQPTIPVAMLLLKLPVLKGDIFSFVPSSCFAILFYQPEHTRTENALLL